MGLLIIAGGAVATVGGGFGPASKAGVLVIAIGLLLLLTGCVALRWRAGSIASALLGAAAVGLWALDLDGLRAGASNGGSFWMVLAGGLLALAAAVLREAWRQA